MRKSNAEETLGERLFVALISYQLGISMRRARKLYITNPGAPKLDPAWEEVGAALLGNLHALLMAAPVESDAVQ